MHVVGKAVLVGRFVLFMTLIVAHVQAFGQKVIVVDLNDVVLRGSPPVGLSRRRRIPNLHRGRSGLLWPTPSAKVRTLLCIWICDGYPCFGTPQRHKAELRLPLAPLRVGLSSAEVEEQSDDPLSFMNSLELGDVSRHQKCCDVTFVSAGCCRRDSASKRLCGASRSQCVGE